MLGSLVVVGCCYPPRMLEKLISNHDISDIPANVLCWKIVQGISATLGTVVVLNEKKSPSLKPRDFKRSAYSQEKITLLEYSCSRMGRIRRALRLAKELRAVKESTVLVYSLNTVYLLPVIISKKHNRNRIVLYVPDLPCYMSSNRSPIYLMLKKIDALFQSFLLKQVDGFVLIAERMKEKLRVAAEKPCLVMEGITDYDALYLDTAVNNRITGDFVFYGGSLSARYGISTLLEAFSSVDLGDIKLVICGDGDYVDEVVRLSSSDERIMYLGLLPRNEVIALEKRASLLVNPRSCSDPYTRYSFPSKTMEYLASGTPLMMERLEGIPEEYYQFIYEVKNGDWVSSLKGFFSLAKEQREKLGRNGSAFVRQEKNMRHQGRRLATFLESING